MVFAQFRYTDGLTPCGYVCADCGAENVRLYREYQTFLDSQRLRCRCCSLANQDRSEAEEFGDGSSEHSIRWLVAAVPTEDGSTYWGYTSVPDAGVKWWEQLPKK
jgi:hypothetical protein